MAPWYMADRRWTCEVPRCPGQDRDGPSPDAQVEMPLEDAGWQRCTLVNVDGKDALKKIPLN